MGIFFLGLVVGLCLGLVVIGFLALGSYERGRDFESTARRRLIHAA